MSYLQFLKRTKLDSATRWIVKYNKENLVREVKQIFNPNEYREQNRREYGHKARIIYTKKGVITVLEKDKEKRKND